MRICDLKKLGTHLYSFQMTMKTIGIGKRQEISKELQFKFF